MLTFSPLCTDIVLGMLLFLKGKEEVKEERYGMWSMRTEFGVFLRSYLPSPIRNCSNLSPFLTPVFLPWNQEEIDINLEKWASR